MKKYNWIFAAISFLLFLSCHGDKQREKIGIAIPATVINKSSILKKKVLNNLKNKDSFQIKSAMFLLDNLKYQKNFKGLKIDTYTDLINDNCYNQDTLIGKIKKIKNNFAPDKNSYDIFTVSEKNIEDNISFTYNTFLKCNWKNKISLDIYCQYLLPYKVNKEHYVSNWRKKLQDQFLIENGNSVFTSDMFVAATQIHKWLYSKKKLTNYCPMI